MGDYYLVINDNLSVTPNHRFFTSNGWVQADNLKINDVLFCYETHKECKIESIEKVYNSVVTYDLTVKNFSNFYVLNNEDFVLVHNQPPKLPVPPKGYKIVNNPTHDIYTGYPYNFTFSGAYDPCGVDRPLKYNYIFGGVDTNTWHDHNWTYYVFPVATLNFEIKVVVMNNTGFRNSTTFNIPRISQGEYIPYDSKLNSTIISTHKPKYIDIVKPPVGGIYTYTILTSREIKGAVRIDLYTDDRPNDYTLNGTLPVGRIWVFDLGSINHHMQYSEGSCTNIYQNGAVFSHFADSDKAILTDHPNFYENESKDVIGFRIIQIRFDEGSNAVGGSGLFKVNLKTKSNYVRDATPINRDAPRDNISNFYISVYGENSVYWLDFLSNYYNFKTTIDYNTLKYKTEHIQLVLSSAIIKASIG
jgi:hypothetical protein